MENLEFTGERLTTSVESIHGVIEHLHRYAIAQKITKNKIFNVFILEIGLKTVSDKLRNEIQTMKKLEKE